ncbi:MAG: hypothetical protein CMD62_05395 [Gammaproteobacteria bacterium]|nr:hypothetical protein [Gammaproteobacteria bacterium]
MHFHLGTDVLAKEFSKNILKRTPSGLIVAILAILSLYSQSILINQFAISVLIILGMIEILNLTKNKVTLAVASIVMFIVISIITIDLIKFLVLFSALLWILILIAMTFFREWFGKLDHSIIVTFNLMGFYAAFLFMCSISNINEANNFLIIFFIVLNTAVFDISAYLFGTNYGKTKIFPNISPNKSLEGFVFGLIICFLLLMVFLYFQFIDIKMLFILLLSLLFAMLGDIYESYFKRINHVKDSGTILPGHGGILDRIDSHMCAFPLVTIVTIIFL